MKTAHERSLVGPMILALATALAVAGVLLPDYYRFLVAQVLIMVVVTIGLDIVYGRTGQLTLAHASFMGIGAYCGAIAAEFGVPFWLQPPLVLAVALIAGAVLAVPTLRLSGLRLAVVTLLFGELFRWWVVQFAGLTGGSQGKIVDPIEVGSFSTAEPAHAFVLAAVLALGATLLARGVETSQLGRRMLAVRDSELAATSTGVPIVRTKITAFMFAAAFAGIGGWAYGAVTGFLSPTLFDLFPSAYMLVAVILGGPGTLLGPWLGAAFVVLLPEFFSAMDQANLFPLLGGGVMIAVALLLPQGIAGTIAMMMSRRMARK